MLAEGKLRSQLGGLIIVEQDRVFSFASIGAHSRFT
jgi:hypothetical protein